MQAGQQHELTFWGRCQEVRRRSAEPYHTWAGACQSRASPRFHGSNGCKSISSSVQSPPITPNHFPKESPPYPLSSLIGAKTPIHKV